MTEKRTSNDGATPSGSVSAPATSPPQEARELATGGRVNMSDEQTTTFDAAAHVDAFDASHLELGGVETFEAGWPVED